MAGTISTFLRGTLPSPNPAASALERNPALAAEIAPRFLSPTVDEDLVEAIEQAAQEAPPGGLRETLEGRGLLPAALAGPLGFELGWPPSRSNSPNASKIEAVTQSGDRYPAWWLNCDLSTSLEASLPYLVPRWPAISTALLFLQEASTRLRPWKRRDERTAPVRVVVMLRHHVTMLMNTQNSVFGNLLGVVGHKRGAQTPARWPDRLDPVLVNFGEQSDRPELNSQSRILLESYTQWCLNAELGVRFADRCNVRTLPSSLRTRGFRDTSNPFEPLVEVLKLGLGLASARFEGADQLVLLVPVSVGPWTAA